MRAGILKDKITSFFRFQNLPQDIRALIFKKAVTFIILCCILSLIYIISYVGKFNFIDSIKETVGVFVLTITKVFAIITGSSLEIDWNNKLILFNDKSHFFFTNQMFAIRYYFLAAVFVFILEKQPGKTVINLLVIWMSFIFLSSSLHLFRVYNTEYQYLNYNFVLEEIISIFLVGYVLLNYLKAKKHDSENQWLHFLINKQVFLYLFVGLVWLILSLYPHYIDKQFFYDIIVKITFSITSGLLKLFGYQNYYLGRYIYGDYIRILLKNPCVGIKIIQVFILIMVFLKGESLYKVPYILIGTFVIILLNALRIFFLFIYFELNKGVSGIDKESLHNIFNIVVYIAVICLWLFYLFFYKKWTEKPIKKQ